MRLFPTREVLAGRQPDELTPDGAHLDPAAHRVVGEALASIVDDWAGDQTHLRPGTFQRTAR